MRYLKTYERFSTLELEDILTEINYDVLDNTFEVEVKHVMGVLFNMFKNEIETLQKGYWGRSSHQTKIENVSEIILVSLRPKSPVLYNDVKEYIERAVEYMNDQGYNYLLEPVWYNSIGIKYTLKDINQISDKELASFHIKFYK